MSDLSLIGSPLNGPRLNCPPKNINYDVSVESKHYIKTAQSINIYIYYIAICCLSIFGFFFGQSRDNYYNKKYHKVYLYMLDDGGWGWWWYGWCPKIYITDTSISDTVCVCVLVEYPSLIDFETTCDEVCVWVCVWRDEVFANMSGFPPTLCVTPSKHFCCLYRYSFVSFVRFSRFLCAFAGLTVWI